MAPTFQYKQDWEEFCKQQGIYCGHNPQLLPDYTCGPGWLPLVEALVVELNSLPEGNWSKSVFQIKEKFGTLRFYIDQASELAYSIIMKYESKSGGVCEYCGAPGMLRRKGWYKTLCGECSNDPKMCMACYSNPHRDGCHVAKWDK